MPRLITASNQYKQDSPAPVLHVNTGDSAGGRNARHQNWMTWILNRLGVDVATLGNHEFDLAPDDLKIVLKQATFPTVVNNLTGAEALPVVGTQIINGVGIVGLTRSAERWKPPKAYKALNLQSQTLDHSIASAQKAIDRLSAQGINKVVVLSHMGFKRDKVLAASLAGADVIVGGDSHTVLKGVMDGVNWVNGKDGKPVLIVQAGTNGHYLGVADLTFNDTGHLTYVGNRLIPTQSFKPDDVAQQYLEAKLGQPAKLGHLSEPLMHDDVLQSAAFRQWLPTKLRQATHADLALMTCKEWRADLPAGPINQWQVNAAFPYADDPYVTVAMPAARVLNTLLKVSPKQAMISPLVVKRDVAGQPVALWSETGKHWVSGDQPVRVTLNQRVVKFLAKKMGVPADAMPVTSTHTFSLAQFAGNVLGQYTHTHTRV